MVIFKGIWSVNKLPWCSRSFDTYDPKLTIALNTLPLSAFPPNYTEVQEDYYRSYKPTIGPRDITELGTWLGGVSMIPAPQLSGYDVNFPWRTLPRPQGKIFVDNSTQPTGFYEAFNATYHALCMGHECSNFRITVNGIGALGPFGFRDSNLANIPEVIQSMFNRSLAYNVRMMDLAADDLHGKEIGSTYLCTKTTKKVASRPQGHLRHVRKLFRIVFGNFFLHHRCFRPSIRQT